jgi:uncharacterized repeat protein (TIGR01451 family)
MQTWVRSLLTLALLLSIPIGAFSVPAERAQAQARAGSECDRNTGYNKFQINDQTGDIIFAESEFSTPPGMVVTLTKDDDPNTSTWEYKYRNTSEDWLISRIVLKAGRSSQTINTSDQEGTIVAPENISHITFCLSQEPELDLVKKADATSAGPGDTITYTLTYSNKGFGPARNTVIKEPIPAGTEYQSCTGGCTTNGPPVTEVTWSVGTVEGGKGGSVTLTVKVLDTVGCEFCNKASISSPDQDDGAPIFSNEVCLKGEPAPRPGGASSHDSAYAARVTTSGLPVEINTTLVPVSSSQSGVGSDRESDQLLSVTVPTSETAGFGSGDILTAAILRSTSTSTVTESPPESRHTSTAEVLNVDILNGLVTASTVRGVASTTASGTESSYSSNGSTFQNLVVNGVAMTDVTPGTTVDLSAVHGPGSQVVLYERTGSTSNSGGTYAADLTVRMIHVFVYDALPLVDGAQTVDVVVSEAKAHSDFPQTAVCAPAPQKAVSGHAFIASAQTNPSVAPVVVGYASIPATGGQDHQNLHQVAIPSNGSTVEAGTSVSDSQGTVGTTSSNASSFANVHNVCVLETATGCTVGATLVKSQSNSTANSSGASSNPSGTELVGVTVMGTSVGSTPAPNTVVPLDADGGGSAPSVGYVILNEQFCDNGATLANNCADGTGHAGLTVRAIHVVLTTAELGAPAGAEVIVSEAHSDVTYR